MNTITKPASTNTILAIDLGKYKSVACVCNQVRGEFRFTTFETTRAELQRLMGKEQPTVVIIEACLLAGWVHDLCVELGIRSLVANTASEAWKFKHLKRKTDKDDALRLAPALPSRAGGTEKFLGREAHAFAWAPPSWRGNSRRPDPV